MGRCGDRESGGRSLSGLRQLTFRIDYREKMAGADATMRDGCE